MVLEDLWFDMEDEEVETETFFTSEEEQELLKKSKENEEKMALYYAELTKTLLDYILTMREKSPTEPVVQIITQFCFENDLEPELVGDAISHDIYLTNFIESDCCRYPEYMLRKSGCSQLDEW